MPETLEPQDGAGERVVAETGDGAASAFAAWVEAQRTQLLAHLSRRLSPALRRQVEAEDILQEAVLEVLRAPEHLAISGAGNVRAWLLAIAENRIRRAARRARPRARPRRTTPLADDLVEHGAELAVLAAVGPAHGERSAAQEDLLRLLARLRELPGDERSILVLRTWLDLSWETVAFILDRPSAGAARQLHARARRRLASKGAGILARP